MIIVVVNLIILLIFIIFLGYYNLKLIYLTKKNKIKWKKSITKEIFESFEYQKIYPNNNYQCRYKNKTYIINVSNYSHTYFSFMSINNELIVLSCILFKNKLVKLIQNNTHGYYIEDHINSVLNTLSNKNEFLNDLMLKINIKHSRKIKLNNIFKKDDDN